MGYFKHSLTVLYTWITDPSTHLRLVHPKLDNISCNSDITILNTAVVSALRKAMRTITIACRVSMVSDSPYHVLQVQSLFKGNLLFSLKSWAEQLTFSPIQILWSQKDCRNWTYCKIAEKSQILSFFINQCTNLHHYQAFFYQILHSRDAQTFNKWLKHTKCEPYIMTT